MEKKNNDGLKSIKVCIYFHTYLDKNIKLPQKVALNAGKVVLPTNHRQGIRASDSDGSFFGRSQGTWEEAVKNELKKQGIKLIKDEKIGEYKKFLKTKDEFFIE